MRRQVSQGTNADTTSEATYLPNHISRRCLLELWYDSNIWLYSVSGLNVVHTVDCIKSIWADV